MTNIPIFNNIQGQYLNLILFLYFLFPQKFPFFLFFIRHSKKFFKKTSDLQHKGKSGMFFANIV